MALTAEEPRRNTRQRQVILEELRKLTSHPTAGELYQIVRERLPRISLGTVYRNLELLTSNGAIQKLQISGTVARFDGNPARHNHIQCTECGRLGDLHDIPADPLAGAYSEVAGWEIAGYRIEFIGVCPECRKKLRTPENPNRSNKNTGETNV